MYYAPIGLCAYFASLVGEYGKEIIGSYAKSMIFYYIMALIYYIVFYSSSQSSYLVHIKNKMVLHFPNENIWKSDTLSYLV